MIIYLVSGITFQVSLAARNGSTRRESCAEIDSIIDDEEDDDGTLCCHGWHLDIDLFICVRMYMYVYIYCDFTIWNPNLHFRHVSGFTKGTRPDLLAQASPGSGRVEASQAS